MYAIFVDANGKAYDVNHEENPEFFKRNGADGVVTPKGHNLYGLFSNPSEVRRHMKRAPAHIAKLRADEKAKEVASAPPVVPAVVPPTGSENAGGEN